VVTTIEDFTAYKNRNSGIWGRGEQHVYKGLKFADNGIGFTHAGGNFDGGTYEFTSRVMDSLFVGESDNIGNPRTPEEVAYGRSLPQPKVPDFPIRAYEFYDQFHELDNITFINYEDNDTRKTGAISHLLFTSFGMSTYNTARRMQFINAKPVYHPPLEPAENNNRWSNDDWGNVSYQTSVFNDADGSITGIPDSYIIITGGIDGMDGCEERPTWNAVVCTGDIGRMNLGGGGITGLGGGRGAGGVQIAPGGGRIRGTIEPTDIVISRNGNEFLSNGGTNIRAGSEYTVTTGGDSVNLRVMELDPGSWVMFEVPGFTTAAAGAEQSSLDALRGASETSWFKADDALWVKLVSTADRRTRDADSLEVRR
jgi:cell migration-inducing and hyaluronan-binding protein